jgi:cation diffusion facilitator CzcD-associated flavoprotein CzcO
MLDWIIIGAGVHGLHLAAALVGRGDSVRLVDPHPRPLAAWDRRADALSMSHLRSPIDHDLDVAQLSLHHFAEAQPRLEPGSFAGPCRSPALGLFRRHVEWVRARLGLDPLLLQATAHAIELGHATTRVETDRGSLRARRVVLALGRPRLEVPRWAEAIGGTSLHVLESGFDPQPGPGPVVIVGGGLSAIQLALEWARVRPGQVTLVCRRSPKIAELDVAPRWARPSWSQRFAALPIVGRWAVRAREIRRASVPRRSAERLARARRSGTLRVVIGEVVDAAPRAPGLLVELADQSTIACRRVALATGHAPGFEQIPLFEQLIGEHGLPVDQLGTPVLDEQLRWHPRIHVAGAAARLSLGPPAANIAGARLAAQRLIRLARE